MGEAQSDLIVWYKLETEFLKDHVRHTKYVGKAKNRNEKRKEDWKNCGELGRGGFGVVHKQIQETTGHYRAVKTIDKRLYPKADHSRELLVMAILAKVCGFTLKEFTQVHNSSGYYRCGLIVNCFSVHHFLWSSRDGSRGLTLCILQWNISKGAISPSISAHRYHKKPSKIFRSRCSKVSK